MGYNKAVISDRIYSSHPRQLPHSQTRVYYAKGGIFRGLELKLEI